MHTSSHDCDLTIAPLTTINVDVTLLENTVTNILSHIWFDLRIQCSSVCNYIVLAVGILLSWQEQ